MSEVLTIPMLTREELIDANLEAVAKNFSAYCWHETLKQVTYEGNKHPVTAADPDPDGNMVCRVLIGPNEIVLIALSPHRYKLLGTVQVDMAVIEAMAEAAESPIN